MKFLLLIAILWIAYMVWRNGRIEQGKQRSAAPPRPEVPQEMVSCPVCSVHLPRSEAVVGRDGRCYCGQEHRQRAGA